MVHSLGGGTMKIAGGDSYTLYNESDDKLNLSSVYPVEPQGHMLAYLVRYPKLPDAWKKD